MQRDENTIRYGEELSSEKHAKENMQAREIVAEINNFGVTERQKLFIIYLLGLELENIEHMREVTAVVRDLGKDTNMLISDQAEDSNGKIN